VIKIFQHTRPSFEQVNFCLVQEVDGSHSQREAPLAILFPVALEKIFHVNFVADVLLWPWRPCSLSQEVATAQIQILSDLSVKTFISKHM